jgi:hypothetical protein
MEKYNTIQTLYFRHLVLLQLIVPYLHRYEFVRPIFPCQAVGDDGLDWRILTSAGPNQ